MSENSSNQSKDQMYIYDCGCPIRENMTKEELIEEVYRSKKMCSHSKWICSNADKEMRRAMRDMDSRKYRIKKLRDEGLSKEEAEQRVSARRSKRIKTAKIDLGDL